jgi:hypothetical protein
VVVKQLVIGLDGVVIGDLMLRVLDGYHVKDSLHRSGEWLDGMTYTLLASEWAARDGPLTAP